MSESDISGSFDRKRESQSEPEENPLEAIRRMRQQKLHACALKQKAEMEEMLATADAKAKPQNQESAD
ncbi:hypothetical protein [Thalassolituus hydrocarboniclasticus]|uniref:Uncharacterized protein n=1 Tax=Thalassolituus hydrocarboniclasticus TaxID=2742796 RepID=A0ABY6AB69_9GAMM|nr:hypothetical protein [Thalassolituus hydrocarboniclasticus]UXD87160.1 hypothetical protein HUF19_06780 [Thalassolituus hydrocarboniclasticus]